MRECECVYVSVIEFNIANLVLTAHTQRSAQEWFERKEKGANGIYWKSLRQIIFRGCLISFIFLSFIRYQTEQVFFSVDAAKEQHKKCPNAFKIEFIYSLA